MNEQPGTIPVRLALLCECGEPMQRTDATETHVMYQCPSCGHVFSQERKALRYRTGRNETPKDAA